MVKVMFSVLVSKLIPGNSRTDSLRSFMPSGLMERLTMTCHVWPMTKVKIRRSR